MRTLLFAALLTLVTSACAGRLPGTKAPAAPRVSPMSHLIPLPVSVDPSPTDDFLLTAETIIRVPPNAERVLSIGRYLVRLIGLAAGTEPLRVVEGAGPIAGRVIDLQIGEVREPGDEAYELTIAPERVEIRGRTAAGVFYGVQTFRHLLPAIIEYEALRPDKSRRVTVPGGRIADRPRFAWRGAMLDVARHFLTVQDVKRYISLMALHKLNRLHLHLSDDQGWRIEINSWPNLTAHGGSTEVGGGPGGFYSQQEYSELVAYAADHFITIVPEIDMPGHTNAALASYDELNCSGKAPPLYTGIEVGFSALCVEKDVTYTFIDDVVKEISALTPGPYFHVGGDEVKTLTPPQYARFIERVQEIVRKHGKRMIGWDEVSSTALLPTSIVQHWRPKTSPKEAVEKGARIVMSPADRTYLDMKYDATTPIGLTWAAMVSIERAYEWDPAAEAEGVPASSVLGVEAPLWTETVANIQDAEFLAFPRLAALAEVAWSPMERRKWDDFRTRLGAQAPRWSALGINYYRAPEISWRDTG